MSDAERRGDATHSDGFVGMRVRADEVSRAAPRIARRNVIGLVCALPSCALVVTLLASRAHADPPPRVSRIAWSDDGQRVVLVTNRGLIFGDAAGSQFRLMCNQAIGVGMGDPPAIAYASDGRWIAATTSGLKASADEGCSWQGIEPLASLQTPALAQHPTERETLYVAAYGSSQGGIHVTRDGGQNFSVVLSLADNEFTHSLAIAASNPKRLYAAGIAFDGAGNFTHYLLRSADGGTSWERFSVALGELDDRAAIVAVHPSNEDEILLKTTSLTPEQHHERVLLSRDAGENFMLAFAGWRLSDVSYAKLGEEVWIASVEGLWRSTDVLARFEKQGVAQWMSCVAEHKARLWGCGMFAGSAAREDGVGISSDGGQAFEPWMRFSEVDEPVACAPDAPTSVACEAAWAHWQFEVLGLPQASDASTGSGGSASRANSGGSAAVDSGDAVGGTGSAARETTGGAGCSVACRQHSAASTFLAVTALGLSCARRRRRRGARRTVRTFDPCSDSSSPDLMRLDKRRLR